jgi:hypothetical protein
VEEGRREDHQEEPNGEDLGELVTEGNHRGMSWETYERERDDGLQACHLCGGLGALGEDCLRCSGWSERSLGVREEETGIVVISRAWSVRRWWAACGLYDRRCAAAEGDEAGKRKERPCTTAPKLHHVTTSACNATPTSPIHALSIRSSSPLHPDLSTLRPSCSGTTMTTTQ